MAGGDGLCSYVKDSRSKKVKEHRIPSQNHFPCIPPILRCLN